MPKADKKTVLLRQWIMVQKIPRRPPGITAGELCAFLEELGYPVTKRTVERDLLMLSESGLKLACNDKSPPFGWYFPPHVEASFGDIDLPEALSLRMAEETLRPLLPPAFLEALEGRFDKARKRLDYNPQSAQARWRTKVARVEPMLSLRPPRIDGETLRTVQLAVLNERQLNVRYKSHARRHTVDLTLHPLGLVHRGPVAYLIATAFDYTDPRPYALHRMHAVEALPAGRRAPKGFRLDRYIGQERMGFGEAGPIALEAILSDDLATYLEETPLSKDQRIERTEAANTLRATVRHTWQLHMWILSQGAGLTVRKPAELRQSIAATLRDAVRNYANDNTGEDR
jgi:predicted DNA-binding transcriptional regulator YafY